MSYLRQTVRDKLNLETRSRATMLINAFGQSAEQLQTCDQVQFTLDSLNDSFQVTIDAYVVPEICAPPPRPPKTGNSRSSVPLSVLAEH